MIESNQSGTSMRNLPDLGAATCRNTRIRSCSLVLLLLGASCVSKKPPSEELSIESIASALQLDRSGWNVSALPASDVDVPAYAIDGDINTRFSSGTAMVGGEWFQVDMGSLRSFDRVEMDSATSIGDYARGYEVYVSMDGTTWGSSIASGAGTTQLISITFAAQTARFIRVVQTGASSSWWSIHEFNVSYGSCTPETNPEFCARLGKNCGLVSGTDNCGDPRVVPSCGACTPPESCSPDNVCRCVPETNPEFCARLGKNCGLVTGTDNCGQPRVVPSCGTCTPPATCSPDNVCIGDCTPETDAAFCARLGRNCGTVNGTDNCNNPRTVESCGTCTPPAICGPDHVCITDCTPETDAAFCARLGRNCGTVSGTDNCNNPRTVASCGTCTPPAICDPDNVCRCTPETDTAFCARLGKNCGTVSGTDNCNNPRTVVSCGECTPPATCSADHVCTGGCTPETNPQFCARIGRVCGLATGTDNCGNPRTVPSCGTCSISVDPCFVNRCNAGGQCALVTPSCPTGTFFVCGETPYCSRSGTPADSNLPCGP